MGGSIPKEFISSVEKGFRSMMTKGRLIGFPVVNMKFVLDDGGYHAVDSSDMAFQAAAMGAFREAYQRAKPVILEPMMKVTVEGPTEFQGAMVKTLMQRRGMITGSVDDTGFSRIEADVPLSEMFAYSNIIRSSTQGKGEFSMEFSHYSRVPEEVSADLKLKYAEALRS